MFYETSAMESYFLENSEPNPLFISPNPGPDSARFERRISSKFVCNTLFRPPARIFHPVLTGDSKTAYDELLEDYDNSECYCGLDTEEYLYFP